MIKKDTFIEIETVVLDPKDRSPHIPLDTKDKPLVMKVKGFLMHDAILYDQVSIVTITNRIEFGKLIKVEPSYHHTFGEYVDILMKVRQNILKEMGDFDE